ALWAIPLVYFLLVAAEFVAMTHVAFVLTRQHFSATAVGFVATLMWLGIFSGSMLASHVTPRFGREATFRRCVQALVLCFALIALTQGYWPWALLGYALGVVVGVIWVTGEAWLAEIAPPDRRGYYVGLFETCVGIGMMTGPVLLALIDRAGWPPLWIAFGMGLVTLAAGRLLPHTAANALPGIEDTYNDKPVDQYPWKGLLLGIAGVSLISGLLESGSAAMLPGLSLRLGFSVQQAAWLGAVIGAGSALLQTPAGHLSDRVGQHRILLACWVVLVLSSAVLGIWGQDHHLVLWLAGFVFGGMGGVIYTLAMVELGHKLQGKVLVHATSVLVVCYTAGSASGPVLGGWLFDRGGLVWLAAGLGSTAMVGLGLSVWRSRAHAMRPDRVGARP
ncbi:MAG TPA: MFS transporter, partial [Fluviicoccus sp.]|nr:MFS transporter [Fluviicoccus sp.]